VETMIKTSQEQMRAKTKAGLAEMKVPELEAGVEHCEGLPRAEATHAVTFGVLMFCIEALKEQHMRRQFVHLTINLGVSIWPQDTATN
jgi:hypothetical protein